jgi:hypothetical protein
MFKFLDEIIETFSRFDSIILKATAAPEDLFTVDGDDTPILQHQKREISHSDRENTTTCY